MSIRVRTTTTPRGVRVAVVTDPRHGQDHAQGLARHQPADVAAVSQLDAVRTAYPAPAYVVHTRAVGPRGGSFVVEEVAA